MSTDSRQLVRNRPADGVLSSRDGRHNVRFERRLDHGVDRVWRAVSEPEELAHWLPSEVEIDLRPGGQISYVFPEHGPGGEGVVSELDPPNLLEITWNGDVLRFELRPDGEGCLFAFTYTFDDGVRAADFAAGWHGCLSRLDALLAGESVPETMDPWDAVYEQYQEKFGAGDAANQPKAPATDGTVEQGDGAYTLRYERSFDRPPERVWMALTRPEELVKWLAEADIDLKEGGRFNLRWLNNDDEESGKMRGTITCLEAFNLLEVDTDIHGRLRWELRRDGSGCRLDFSATLPAPNDPLTELLAGWHIHLDHLADALHGHPVDWTQWAQDHWDEFVAHHDRYAASLEK